MLETVPEKHGLGMSAASFVLFFKFITRVLNDMYVCIHNEKRHAYATFFSQTIKLN